MYLQLVTVAVTLSDRLTERNSPAVVIGVITMLLKVFRAGRLRAWFHGEERRVGVSFDTLKQFDRQLKLQRKRSGHSLPLAGFAVSSIKTLLIRAL